MGADFLRTGLRLGGRERKQLKSRGFAAETTGATGAPDLDVAELIHVHGRRLPNLMRNASYRVIKRDVRAATDHGSATGSLHWIGVSEQEHARGAMGWTRLCVDTDQTDRLPVLSGDHHLDVVIAPVGQEPAEYASDMTGLLPQGIPAEAWQALTADPPGHAPAPAGPGPYRDRRRRRHLHVVQERAAHGVRLAAHHGQPGQAGRAVAGGSCEHRHPGVAAGVGAPGLTHRASRPPLATRLQPTISSPPVGGTGSSTGSGHVPDWPRPPHRPGPTALPRRPSRRALPQRRRRRAWSPADHRVPASERPVFRTAKRADPASGT
ncbi:Uncharacterised protein [Actinomyces naeslundii]|nr:Uncharacterised protein [Actinomyces naeslundii]